MKWHYRVGAWCLVLGAWSVLGPGSLVRGQQPPVFRSGAEIVAVDAVVHDKSGHPVLDLKPEDFTITEDGRPEPVEQFYLVRGGAVVTPAAPGAAAPATEPTAAAPTVRRTFIVVFDADHMTPGGFRRAQAAAKELFEKRFEPTDVGGVVINGQIANKRLTSDREELLKAVATAMPTSKSNSRLIDLREWPSMNDAEAFQIAKMGLRNDPFLNEVIRRACTDDPDACKREPPDAAVYEKAVRMANDIRASSDQTLRTMAALVNGLERFDGRKSVLLLSEGFIADRSWPIVEQVVGLAARANARIYTLDARGLDNGRQAIGNYAPHDDTLGNLLASFDIGADSMNSLAVDTGGYVVRNTNIFTQTIAEIADETGTYYVLGYHSQKGPDGKFRKISVKVNRPGVTVRARRGYVASPRPAATTDATREPANPEPGTRNPLPDAFASLPNAIDAPLAYAPGAAAIASPSPSTAAPAPAPSALGLRLRPDTAKHVESLGASSDPDTQAKAGWDAYQRGDLETAQASLGAAAASRSAHAWVHYALGQTEYGLRRYRDAVTEWEKVLDSAGDFEPVYFDLVDGYLQLKEYDRATKTMRAAAERWPSDAEVFNALGVVQVARGSLDDAIASFGRAIAVRPDEAIGYFNLAKAHELRYAKSRHFVPQLQTWVTNKQDAIAAMEAYKQYLAIGGPLENSAREGISRLNWVTTQPR